MRPNEQLLYSTDTDDLIDKIGFRRVEVKNNDILLNDKPIELLGVNRHEEHPEWGIAFPPKLMAKRQIVINSSNKILILY